MVPAEYIGDSLSHSYNSQTPTQLADKLFYSFPYPVIARLFEGAVRHRASMEPERYNALEKSDFKIDRDGSPAEHIFERLGGHYVDVGASKKISEGLVRNLCLPCRFQCTKTWKKGANTELRSRSNLIPCPRTTHPMESPFQMIRICPRMS